MKHFFWVCFSFSLSLSFAQSVNVINTDDGLINNNVICLALDIDQNLWFGTQEGISFFDGINFSNYDVNNVPELLSNTISAIAVDGANNLWVGTDFGLNKFDGSTWITYTTADGLGDNRVKYINQDIFGLMWIAHSDGVSVLDLNGDWVSYGVAEGIPFGGANYITYDINGFPWIGTPLAGALQFNGTGFDSYTVDEGLLTDNVSSIAVDKDNNKWIGTSDGVTVLDNSNNLVENHEAFFTLPAPHTRCPVEDLKVSCNGVVWVAVYAEYLVTEGGVAYNDNMVWADLDIQDGLSGPVANRLVTDAENNVWVATSTGITKIENDLCISANEEIGTGLRGSVYPNPVSDILTLETTEYLELHAFRILDLLGREVMNGAVSSKQKTIDINQLQSGFYYLQLLEDQVTLSFVKS